MATWLHLAGVHLDIDPEYEVTRDLTSQRLTSQRPNLCQPEGVKEGGGVQCFLVYRAWASSFQQTVNDDH